ncbi:MAG: trypco2 family protein [Actinomycetales bacterium]
MAPDGVPLAVALDALRAELATAMDNAPTTGLRFRPEEIELTLQTTVTWSGTAGGGISWWLINASAEGSRSSAAVQTVTLKLTPVEVTETGVERTPLIDAPA